MKKILLTASAVSLMAGAAAADVTVGGDARFGIVYDEGGHATTSSEFSVQQRVRVLMRATTQTDGGLTFGATLGAEVRNRDGNLDNRNGLYTANPLITVSGAGLDFFLGNTSGAVQDLVGIWSGGLGFNDELARPGIAAGFKGADVADTQTAKIAYTFGDFKVAASVANAPSDPELEDAEIAVRYSANGITAALGLDADENWAISGSYAFGDARVGAIYRDGPDAAGGDANYRIYGTYTMGATTIGATYTETNAASAAYGIGVSHALGGGVSAHGAIGVDTTDDLVAQLGMKINF